MSGLKTNSGKSRHTILTVSLIILVSIGICAGAGIAKAVNDRSDYYHLFLRMDSVLAERSEVTRYYDEMYWRDNDEFLRITEHMTPSEIVQCLHTIDLWMPNMRALLDGKGDTAVITAEQVDELAKLLQLFAARGNPSLQNDINREMDRMQISDFIGMTMTQAWVHMHAVWGISNPPSPTDSEFLSSPMVAPTWGPPPPLYSIRTPEATLAGSEFANFWAVYRDPDDDYGFAYPADWVFSSEPEDTRPEKGMTVCNNDLDNFYWGDPKGACLLIKEMGGIDPGHPLDQAVSEIICVAYMNQECGPITLSPEKAGRPARAELQFKVMYLDPPQTAAAVAFRTPTGKLIIFYSDLSIMQSPEAHAIVNSFVNGKDTEIIVPPFRPSKKIN